MRLAHSARLISILLSAGCSAGGSAAPRPDRGVDAALTPVLLPGVPSATAAPLPLESVATTLKRELCRRAIDRGREEEVGAKCALAKVRDVGNGSYVTLLYRGTELWKPDGSSAAELDLTSEGNSDSFGVDFAHCEPYEYWLASVAEGKLTKAQLITSICNEGHGAAGVGEDTVTVTAETLTIATNGGSNWRWGHTDTFSLPDLTLVNEAFNGYWSVSSNSGQTEWSWTERKGTATWEAPRCSSGTNDPPPVSFSYTLVPAFENAPAFAADGWKNARSIEGCATKMAGEHAGDALTLVVANGELFVEIHDDKLITEGKIRDELEVWHREDPAGDWAFQCLEEPVSAAGTAIRMGDLSTRLLGDGAGKPLSVERAPTKDGAPIRLRIALPPKTHALTVVYRDSDDGRRHSLITSSTFDAKDAGTLGGLHLIEPAQASCELVDNSLVLRMKPHSSASEPITRGY